MDYFAALNQEEQSVLAHAPLVKRLFEASCANRLSFHMPGHVSGRAYSQALAGCFLSSDTTELPQTEDLNDPGPWLKETCDRLSRIYSSAQTFLLTGGATQAIQTALLALCGKGGRLLILSTAHRSFLYAAHLLDLELAVISPGDPTQFSKASDNTSLFVAPDPIAIERYLARAQKNGQLPHVLALTHPDYYGQLAPVKAVADICHRYGVWLLVDEAHGALWPFDPPDQPCLPLGALHQAADVVVHSAHKTLPALTPTAMLHLGHGLVQQCPQMRERVQQALRLLQTSSPSLMQAATVDWAAALLAVRGGAWVCRHLPDLTKLRADLSALPGFRCLCPPDQTTFDPFRLVIHTGGHACALLLAEQLQAEGIDVEMADLTRLVLIVSPFHTSVDFDRLREVLSNFSRSGGQTESETKRLNQLDRAYTKWCTRDHLQVDVQDLLPQVDAWIQVPLHQAAGQILALPLVPYPPGVVLAYPGERLSADLLSFLSAICDYGLSVQGIEQVNGQRCVPCRIGR